MWIGACQTPETLGDLDAAICTNLDFAGKADEARLDLLLFPECFLQGYLVTEQHVHSQAIELASPQLTAVLEQLSGVRQMLVLGMIERQGCSYYNTAVVITGGRIVGSYRKTFLTGGESVFTAGDAYPVFTCRGLLFGINICYDTQFPQAAAAIAARRRPIVAGAGAEHDAPRQGVMVAGAAQLDQGTAGPRETGMWLTSADVTGQRDESRIGLGPTCVMAPTGHVVAQIPLGTVGTAIAEINQRRPNRLQAALTSHGMSGWLRIAPRRLLRDEQRHLSV